MNYMSSKLLKKANEEAIYNLYLYLANKTNPKENQSLKSIVWDMESLLSTDWTVKEIYRLKILKNAVINKIVPEDSTIGNLIISGRGLTACTFTKPNEEISVAFKGTGSGEWIDNGEGLSGKSRENIYITYEKGGKPAYREIHQHDYATDQQVEALNWFRHIVAKNRWDNNTRITLSGHSKGGNKAQFIAINSEPEYECFSFSGQGFSPEAIKSFKNNYGQKYEEKRQHIQSLSAENDYVNVLGEHLVPEKNIYYFKSRLGIHYPEAILDKTGILRSQANQGKLSIYIENISNKLMKIKPSIRQHATLGVMSIFQKYLGEDSSDGNNSFVEEDIIEEIGNSIGPFINRFYNSDSLWK